MHHSVAIVVAAMLSVACTQAPARPSPSQASSPVASPSAVPSVSSTPEPQAHFAVSELDLVTDPADVVPGDDVRVSAQVENDGSAAGTYIAELAVAGAVVGQQNVSLEAGHSIGVEFDFVAGPAGEYTVALDTARLVIQVLGPASFRQSILGVSPNPVALGSDVEVSVLVTNSGGLAGDHDIELFLDGERAATQSVTVGGGTSATVRFPVTASSAGPHLISIDGDQEEFVVWDLQRPANGTALINKLRGGEGRLTVDNGNDRDAFIALVRATNTAKSPLAFYVRAGESHIVSGIRDGTYLVFYSLGNDWDAYSRRFTEEADYGRFSDGLSFVTTRTTYSVWTLTLHTVLGGNALTETVTEGAFPGLEDESGG